MNQKLRKGGLENGDHLNLCSMVASINSRERFSSMAFLLLGFLGVKPSQIQEEGLPIVNAFFAFHTTNYLLLVLDTVNETLPGYHLRVPLQR